MPLAHPLGGLRAVNLRRGRPGPGRTVLPDACCDIVVAGERAWMLGPMTRGRPALHVGEMVTVVQTHPLATRAWLGVALDKLADRRIPLDDLVPHATETLLSALANGQLRRRLPQTHDPRLLAAARALRRGEAVRAAALRANWSERQLERRWLDAFGMAPKRFAQVLRFRRAVLAIHDGARFADAAADFGFADQAHLSRTARDLTGRTLRELSSDVGFVQERAARFR